MSDKPTPMMLCPGCHTTEGRHIPELRVCPVCHGRRVVPATITPADGKTATGRGPTLGVKS